MIRMPPNQHIPKDLALNDDDLAEAVSKFGTPLYLYDGSLIRARWKTLRSLLPKYVTVFYSAKANPNIWVINAFGKLGASCEVASFGELMAALRAGISASDLVFVGPGKSRCELRQAISRGVALVVVESTREIEEIQALSQELVRKTPVALRINPGRGKGSIRMGGITQFGMEAEVALGLLKTAHTLEGIQIVGLHAYLGTGVLDWKHVLAHTKTILQTADRLQRQSGRALSFIDVGGGFGIPYHHRDKPTNWECMKEPIAELLNRYLTAHPQTETIAVESGRFLIGPAGVFLASVLDVKRTKDTWFVILDGGINVFGGDDPYRGFRPPPIRIVGCEREYDQPVTLCGPLCTTADRLATDLVLPMPQQGDVIAFYQAGAYRFSASPGLLLSHGFPREAMVKNGRFFLIRERLSPERFLRTQPDTLKAV